MRETGSKMKLLSLTSVTAMWLLLSSAAQGLGKRKPIDADTFDEVIPQFVFGGPWSTQVAITNLEDTEVRVPIRFYRPNGQPWTVPLKGRGRVASIELTLAPKATAFFETEDAGGELQQGWALLDVEGIPDFGGFAVFRNRTPGQPLQEAVVPFADSFESTTTLIFDETEGYATALALVNPRSFGGQTFTLAFRDEAGLRFHLDQTTLGQLNQTTFLLRDRYPQVVGKKGTVEIQGVSSYIGALGLRFNPTGPFTSFHSFER